MYAVFSSNSVKGNPCDSAWQTDIGSFASASGSGADDRFLFSSRR